MTNANTRGGHLNGVVCDVKSCAYNHDGSMCCADAIMVQNESAQKKAETFCSTFKTRSGR